MRVRASLLNTRRPKCYFGDGLIIKSGHLEVELNPLEMTGVIKTLSDVGMLNPAHLQKLKDHLEKQ